MRSALKSRTGPGHRSRPERDSLQGLRQQTTSLRSFDLLQNKTEALQRLLREHDNLIDELAAGIEAVRHATRPQPGKLLPYSEHCTPQLQSSQEHDRGGVGEEVLIWTHP